MSGSQRYPFWIGAGLLALSASWNFGARAQTDVAQPFTETALRPQGGRPFQGRPRGP
jgi:hypothetical protein